MFEDMEIPFIKRGNRHVLTELQVAQDPRLEEFIEQFRDSLEYDPYMAWWSLDVNG